MRIPLTLVRVLAVIGLALSSLSTLSAAEKLSLSTSSPDHAVLHATSRSPVWVQAEPGSEVTVEFAGQKKSTTAAADGKWIVRLDPLPANSEPRDLIVQSKIENQKSKNSDVLVGDVWVCSGQSKHGLDAQTIDRW